jgi:VWFA-related protein
MFVRAMTVVATCVGLIVATNAEQQRPSFRSGVTAVRVDVLVSRGGRPVAGLTEADFEVRDNGVLQTIRSTSETGGVDLGLVLDASGSLAGDRLRELVDAADGVLGDLRHGDRAAVLAFNQSVQLLCPPTSDVASARHSLSGLHGLGTTALFDAIGSAVFLLRQGATRPVLIVLTDGLDNSSWLSAEQVSDVLGRAEVVVYIVSPGEPARPEPADRESQATLERLAAQSGGSVLVATASGLRSAFRHVLEEFRTRYLLSFVPTGVAAGDGWHSLQVRVKSGAAKVTARPRYYSGAAR